MSQEVSCPKIYFCDDVSMSNTDVANAVGMHGTCLACSTKGTDALPLRRGLCTKHYERFRRNMLAIDGKEKRVQYEQELIDLGKLLPTNTAKSDIYSDVAQKYLPARAIKDIEAGKKIALKGVQVTRAKGDKK
jgi:hypothetical protein